MAVDQLQQQWAWVPAAVYQRPVRQQLLWHHSCRTPSPLISITRSDQRRCTGQWHAQLSATYFAAGVTPRPKGSRPRANGGGPAPTLDDQSFTMRCGPTPHWPAGAEPLSARFAHARREERFPDLVDPLREVHVPPAWTNATTFLQAVPTGLLWTGRPARRPPCMWLARRTPGPR